MAVETEDRATRKEKSAKLSRFLKGEGENPLYTEAYKEREAAKARAEEEKLRRLAEKRAAATDEAEIKRQIAEEERKMASQAPSRNPFRSLRGRVPDIVYNQFYRDKKRDDIREEIGDAEDREMDKELQAIQEEEARAEAEYKRNTRESARLDAEEKRERAAERQAQRQREAEAAERKRQEDLEKEVDRAHGEGLKDQEERYNNSWKGWTANKFGRGKYQKKPQAAEEPKAPNEGGGGPNEGGGGKGKGAFGSGLVVNNVYLKSSSFWKLLFYTIGGFLLAGWALWAFGKLDIAWKFLKSIAVFLLYAAWILFILGSIVYGIKKKDSAAGWIAAVFVIWLLDRAPFGFFSDTYSGFYFDILGPLRTDVFGVATSVVIYIGMGLYIFTNFLNGRRAWVIGTAMFLVIIRTYGWAVANRPTEITLGTIGMLILAMLIGVPLFLNRKNMGSTSDWSYMVMVILLSYFWMNFGWATYEDGSWNYRALFHVGYILLFCFFYVRYKEEKSPTVWHLLPPIMIALDFFIYDFVSEAGYWGLFPALPILVIMYCAERVRSKYAQFTIAMLVAILLFVAAVNALGNIDVTLKGQEFKPREDGTKTGDALGNALNKLTAYWQGRLDYATGGLYRAQIEQNQYENLGVYFANLRQSEPVFYTNEPVTVWGTIRSKTYQDPVVVNVNCYKQKEEQKLYADRNYPGKPIPVFKLEENDIECTFLPPSGAKTQSKMEPGQNKITLEANYNFATNAYKKAYLMDRDRYRALVREEIDPLDEFGIKDKNPLPVSTNGPVELSISVPPLLQVSNSYVTPPLIAVALINRQEVQDKDRQVISRWEGRIKEITELIILTPPDVKIPLEDCNPPVSRCPCEAPFVEYDVNKCKTSCKKYVLESCTDACAGDTSCQNECQIASKNCDDDCDNLFRVSSGEGDTKLSYNAYALDVDKLKQDTRLKDVDRNKKFECRIFPYPNSLDNTPITTRYFRARARYNYLLENSVTVEVKEVKDTIPSSSLEFKPDAKKEVYFNPSNANEVSLSETVYGKASYYNVDYFFVKAVIQTENSQWNPNAQGDPVYDPNTKAIIRYRSSGLMQVLDDTAARISCLPDYKTNPESNIDCGVRYIEKLIKYQKEKRLIAGPENLAAGYNCGEGGMQYSQQSGYENTPIWQTPNGCKNPGNTEEYVSRFKSNYDNLLAKQAST